MKPYVVPRVMTQADIDRVVRAYAIGAENAFRAGFDGVEIHGANGYIIDSFLQSRTDLRTDAYGGSLENRVRFLAEIVEAVTRVSPPGTVGLRISPTSERKGMGDEDPGALAQAVGDVCSRYEVAYVHLIERIASAFMEKPENPVMERLRSSFRGGVIQNGSFDGVTAAAFVDGGQADSISFGRPFIANPDLVRRIAEFVGSIGDANLCATRPSRANRRARPIVGGDAGDRSRQPHPPAPRRCAGEPLSQGRDDRGAGGCGQRRH